MRMVIDTKGADNMDDNLFKIDIDAKELGKYKAYGEIEKRLDELDKKSDRLDVKVLGKFQRDYVSREDGEKVETKDWKIYGAFAGNPKAEKRIFVIAGHHGEEPAGDLAALKIIEELANPTKELEKVLDESYVMVVPSIDPEGYDFAGRKWINKEGGSSIDPKSKQTWLDINGNWGRRNEQNIPEEIKIVKGALEEFKPGLVVDLHETPYTKRQDKRMYDWVHGNRQGLMIIQSLPEKEKGFGEEILKNIRDRGFKTYKPSLLYKIVSGLQGASAPQVIPLNEDQSLTKEGPMLTETGMKVMTMYTRDRFGAQSYCFESFQNFLDERVGEHVAGVEGAIKSYMNLKGKMGP